MLDLNAVLRRLRKPIVPLIDLLLINLSVFIAFMIRLDWHLASIPMISCAHIMFLASVVKIASFAFFGMYSWSFRHASISEAINVVKAVTLSSLLLAAVAFFAQWIAIERSVLLIDYLVCLFFIGTLRFLPRMLIRFSQTRPFNLKRVLIVGAGTAGAMVAHMLLNAEKRTYQPVGFIDDDPMKLYSRIHGIKVLGTSQEIGRLSDKRKIDEVIITIPSVSGKAIRNIVSKCEKCGVKIKIIPDLHRVLTGEVTIKGIKDIQVTDLLGRGTVEINTEGISRYVRGKVILVTGAGGSIGSELCRQIMNFRPSFLLLYDHCENDTYFLELELKKSYPGLRFKTIIGDIKDTALLNDTFSKYKPHIVFHSAAHKHVTLMEQNPIEAAKNNILGTKNLTDIADYHEVESFVMISSDKAVNPTGIMGATKRAAEIIAQAKSKASSTKFISVRFGNVIGSSGSVVPIFKQQIEKGGPITVTHPETKRFFMTAGEASQLVLQAGTIGKGGEIFTLDMGEQIKILDLAKNLIALSGLEPYEDIEIKFIGLRPGEKLGEEPPYDSRYDISTEHGKIYIARPSNVDYSKLSDDIRILKHLVDSMSVSDVIKKIGDIVPEYIPGDNWDHSNKERSEKADMSSSI